MHRALRNVSELHLYAQVPGSQFADGHKVIQSADLCPIVPDKRISTSKQDLQLQLQHRFEAIEKSVKRWTTCVQSADLKCLQVAGAPAFKLRVILLMLSKGIHIELAFHA